MSRAGFNPFENIPSDGGLAPDMSSSDSALIDETIALAQEASQKDIAHFVDVAGLSNAKQGGKVDNVVAGMLQAAGQAKADIEGKLLQKNLTDMVGNIAAATGATIASAPLFAVGVFNDSVEALKTGDFDKLQNRMSDIINSGKGILTQLNLLETAADGTKISSERVQDIALMPDQFIPQQGLPNLIGPSIGRITS